MPLLWALRDLLHLTGTHYGCGIAQCGACTVHLDDRPVHSCQTTLAETRGRRVTTIEGLHPQGRHPLQLAWIAEQVPQCGYCQSGQIMGAAALLARHPRPTEAQLQEAMAGHLCRCGTYSRIAAAIQRAAANSEGIGDDGRDARSPLPAAGRACRAAAAGRRRGVAGAAAAQVARAMGRPVQLLWRREDEFAQGYWRPAFAARMQAALDAEGRVTGFSVRGAGGSVMFDYRPWLFRNPAFVDPFALQSVADTRYRFGQAFRAEYARVDLPPKVWLWRSVGASQYGFFLESFLDEAARAAGKDPLALRRELLAHDARALAVLHTAAERGGWGTPPPAGRHRGLAYMEAYGSLCAQVAEISVTGNTLKLHKVTVAHDCGDVINSNAVRAQIESSVVWALSAMAGEKITLKDGRAEQRNFDAYPIARMAHAPVVETHILRSGQPLGGVGEPAVPPLAPAVCNALFAATGRRVRSLPLAEHGFVLG